VAEIARPRGRRILEPPAPSGLSLRSSPLVAVLSFGATNTPNLFVIDTKGVLVYAGAIDNSPDGEGESPTGGKLVNYVDQALQEIAAGKPVSTARTRPYGCSVKYASK
jgi:hypothetical protein